MIRAVRLAATLGFGIEPATLAGIQARADLARHLSGERIAAELEQAARGARPSVGLRLMGDTGLLARDLTRPCRPARHPPEQGAGRGPLGPHAAGGRRGAGRSPRRPAGDAAPRHRQARDRSPTAISSVTTSVGAELAGAFMDRLRLPRAVHERIVDLVRNHMFSYEPNWSDAAVRRFIAKMEGIGPGALEELLELREADNIGSACRPRPGGSPSSGRASRQSWRRRSCSIAGASRSTATTSSRSWGSKKDPGWDASSTRCWSRSSQTRRSTTDPRSCSWPSRCRWRTGRRSDGAPKHHETHRGPDWQACPEGPTGSRR